MTNLVEFRDVTLGYGHRPLLRRLEFDIAEGDFLGLVGPNGSGKTTLLRALLGTLEPLSGVIRLAPGIRFGYVPQREQIDPRWPLRVIDVVLMGRYHRIGLGRRPSAADRTAALNALEHVGIADLAERHLSSLSGGQKQRALIARALVGAPTVLILDEPTTGLDLVSTTQILSLVRELHERDRITVLMVSHMLNEVANYVDRLGLLVNGEIRLGPVDQILTEKALTELYGIPVEVSLFSGHRIVLARRPPKGVTP
ncbi:MAG TPA: metal ABC transporter ATP-binding protein [Gemmatimonadales bacterium]|nr:metal ABC transporter ATP-binding protein [Gemmatimonadales bacterium]